MNFDLIIKFIPYLFPGICCSVFLVFFLIFDKTFSKQVLGGFVVSIVFAFLLVICDAIDFYLEFEQKNAGLRQILGSVNFIFRIGCVGALVRISQRKIKYHIAAIDVIILLNSFFSMLNIWTGWIFLINPDHSCSFGVLKFIPYIFIGLLILFFLYSIQKYFLTNKAESFAVISICIVCIVANIVELLFPIKIVLGQAFCISTVFYYLCLISELYKRDALTDVYNRRTFYLDAHRFRNSSFCVIMLDLNDLKKFNDQEGHNAGDMALLTSVECLHKAFKKYGTVYRLGGDEFAVIVKQKYLSKIEELLKSFTEYMASTKYVMAYGYEFYNPGVDFETVVEIADSRMYTNKRKIKGTLPR